MRETSWDVEQTRNKLSFLAKTTVQIKCIKYVLSCNWQRHSCYSGIVPNRKDNLIVSNDVIAVARQLQTTDSWLFFRVVISSIWYDREPTSAGVRCWDIGSKDRVKIVWSSIWIGGVTCEKAVNHLWMHLRWLLTPVGRAIRCESLR